MPLTPWKDIVGYTCRDCGHWASHWHGGAPMCCRCHDGPPREGETYNYVDEMAKIARKFNTLYQRHHGVWDDAWLNDVGEEPRPQDARNTQRVVEQICRPLDEILARYASGPEDAHVAVLKQCRGLLDQLLREYEADPEHPAA